MPVAAKAMSDPLTLTRCGRLACSLFMPRPAATARRSFCSFADVLQRLLQAFERRNPWSDCWRATSRLKPRETRWLMPFGCVRKLNGALCSLRSAVEIVAIGHHRLDVHEVEVAVDVVVDERRRLRPGLEGAAADAIRFNRLIGAIESDVADKRDRHFIGGARPTGCHRRGQQAKHGEQEARVQLRKRVFMAG